MEPIKRYEDTDDYELLMRDIMLMESLEMQQIQINKFYLKFKKCKI